MFWWLLLPALFFTAAAVLTAAVIFSWIEERRNRRSAYTRLIKEKLRNGDYRVHTGIFTEQDTLQDEATWECERLDPVLEADFGKENVIYYNL